MAHEFWWIGYVDAFAVQVLLGVVFPAFWIWRSLGAPDLGAQFSKSFLEGGWRLGWMVAPAFTTYYFYMFALRAWLAMIARADDVQAWVVARLSHIRRAKAPIFGCYLARMWQPLRACRILFRITGRCDIFDVASWLSAAG